MYYILVLWMSIILPHLFLFTELIKFLIKIAISRILRISISIKIKIEKVSGEHNRQGDLLFKIPRIFQDFREFLESQFSKNENFGKPKKYQENIIGKEVALSKIPRTFQMFWEFLKNPNKEIVPFKFSAILQKEAQFPKILSLR